MADIPYEALWRGTGELGDQPVVVLTDRRGHRRLRIAQHGAALLSFEVPLGGATVDLADGYRDAAEIARPARFALRDHGAVCRPHCRRALSLRWPGRRICSRAWSAPSAPAGMVSCAAWISISMRWTADDDGARVSLSTHRDPPAAGLSACDRSRLSFTLDAGGLTLEARMRNVGDIAAPCFFGWHPYFRLADSSLVDGWQLQIPAQTLIRTDADADRAARRRRLRAAGRRAGTGFPRVAGSATPSRPGLYRSGGRCRRSHPHPSAQSGQRAGHRGMAGARRDACVHRRHGQPRRAPRDRAGADGMHGRCLQSSRVRRKRSGWSRGPNGVSVVAWRSCAHE